MKLVNLCIMEAGLNNFVNWRKMWKEGKMSAIVSVAQWLTEHNELVSELFNQNNNDSLNNISDEFGHKYGRPISISEVRNILQGCPDCDEDVLAAAVTLVANNLSIPYGLTFFNNRFYVHEMDL